MLFVKIRYIFVYINKHQMKKERKKRSKNIWTNPNPTCVTVCSKITKLEFDLLNEIKDEKTLSLYIRKLIKQQINKTK